MTSCIDLRQSVAWAAFIVLVAGTSCKKPAAPSEAPALVSDDIASIEAQVARNAADLEAQGIVVAQRDKTLDGTRVDPTTPEPPPEPGADDLGGEGVEETDDFLEPEDEAEDAPVLDAPADAGRTTRFRRRRRRSLRRKKKDGKPTRCDRICDLADATCDLADRVCGLADHHIDEVRYEEACERAADQCRAASMACSGCES